MHQKNAKTTTTFPRKKLTSDFPFLKKKLTSDLRRIGSLALVMKAGLIAGLICLVWLMVADLPVAVAQSSVTLYPTADAHVRSGANQNTNFGAATLMKVKQSTVPTDNNNNEIYLRFDMSSVVGSITSGSKLRLHKFNGTAAAITNQIRSSTVTNWIETGAGSITWANKPALTATVHATGAWSTSAAWFEWDITAFLQAEKAAGRNVVTLVVRNTQATTAIEEKIHSRENTTLKPELVIVTGGGGAPEVNVTGAGLTILDGDTTPQTADGTDFGSADVASGAVPKTFNIQNTGAATLTLGSVTAGGDFTVTTQPPGSIAAGGNANFTVTFNPSATGLRTATVSFTNNDTAAPSESPYNFAVRGTGTSGGSVWPANTVPNNIGVNFGTTQTTITIDDYDQLQAGGYKHVRAAIKRWNEIETSDNVFDFTASDAVHLDLHNRGIKVVQLLGGGGTPTFHPSATTAAGRAAFARFAGKMAERYGSGPSGLNYGFIWEIWNEPERSWTVPEVDNYMTLVKETVAAIRANDPGALIVNGGVTNPAGVGDTGGFTWLQECIARGLITGISGPEKVDGIGIHNYNPGDGDNVALRRVPERIVASVAAIRGLSKPGGGTVGSFPIVMTEWGPNITWFGDSNPNAAVNEQGQAEVGIRGYLLYQLTELKLGIYYRWSPDGLGTDQPERSITGVMRDQLTGYAFESRFNLASTDDYALVYKNDATGSRKLVVWVGSNGAAHNVSIPVTGGTSPFPTVDLLGATGTITRSGGNISPNLKPAVLYINIGSATVP